MVENVCSSSGAKANQLTLILLISVVHAVSNKTLTDRSGTSGFLKAINLKFTKQLLFAQFVEHPMIHRHDVTHNNEL